jgi:hypothetical protein
MSPGHWLAQRSAQAEISRQLSFTTLGALVAPGAVGLPAPAGRQCSTGVRARSSTGADRQERETAPRSIATPKNGIDPLDEPSVASDTGRMDDATSVLLIFILGLVGGFMGMARCVGDPAADLPCTPRGGRRPRRKPDHEPAGEQGACSIDPPSSYSPLGRLLVGGANPPASPPSRRLSVSRFGGGYQTPWNERPRRRGSLASWSRRSWA